MASRCQKGREGFTLIELLLVTTITVILATVLSLALFNFRAEQGLSDDVSVVVAVLRNAQQRSVTQENDGQWGVRFDGANGLYDLFQYPYSGPALRRQLSAGVEFFNLGTDPKYIVFGKISGCRYDTTALPPACFTTSDSFGIRRIGGTEKTITVNANGTITY